MVVKFHISVWLFPSTAQLAGLCDRYRQRLGHKWDNIPHALLPSILALLCQPSLIYIGMESVPIDLSGG